MRRVFDAWSGRVQVAGIRSVEEGRMLLDCGVDWIGFPLRLPVHAEDLSEPQAREIVRVLGADACVLITYETNTSALLDLCRYVGATTVQMHADMCPQSLAVLRRHCSARIIKSYVVGLDARAPDDFVRAYAPVCDAFITDTYDVSSGASGATGQLHDWAVSAELVSSSPRPVILAGGLTPDNVGRAIRVVRPAAVDAHTGLEDATGAKDCALVRDFVRAAREGFEATGRKR